MNKPNKNSLANYLHTKKDEGKEKHVPVIYCPEEVTAGEIFEIKIAIGEEVPHPNTWEHHIKWIQVFVKEENKEPVHVATFDLGPTIAEPKVTVAMKLNKSATIHAVEYCNIHGLWESYAEIKVSG
ncbi:MAG TPA: desulfoferrodoxin [Peptococcaceae bacterium]|nr:MAG: Superoxide reductase (SOR) [Clostridia bacterium 41_269]HBT20820.1 desulfoferrodoxin [Peptococcaceae bacterium]